MDRMTNCDVTICSTKRQSETHGHVLIAQKLLNLVIKLHLLNYIQGPVQPDPEIPSDFFQKFEF